MGDLLAFKPRQSRDAEFFEREHVAGTIGNLTVVVGPLGTEGGLPLWGVVIRQAGKPDHRVMRGTFNADLGPFDQFQKGMADHALIVADVLSYASRNSADLISEPDGAA